jgi:hypothetical protein
LRWIENVDPQGTVTMVPLTDRLTQKQLAFSNVILVFAFYKEYNPTLQDVQMWDNQDGLRAVVFRDGKAIEGIWKTKAKDQPIRFFTSQDKPLILKPGNSWMIITGWNSSLQTSKGLWNLTFALP